MAGFIHVAFVGFNTWPVMPRCWQPPSHDSVPSGTALPRARLQGLTIHREPVGRPELPQPHFFPPHTSLTIDLGASGMKPTLLHPSFLARLPNSSSITHHVLPLQKPDFGLNSSTLCRHHAIPLPLASSSQASSSSPGALVLICLPHSVSSVHSSSF